MNAALAAGRKNREQPCRRARAQEGPSTDPHAFSLADGAAKTTSTADRRDCCEHAEHDEQHSGRTLHRAHRKSALQPSAC